MSVDLLDERGNKGTLLHEFIRGGILLSIIIEFLEAVVATRENDHKEGKEARETFESAISAGEHYYNINNNQRKWATCVEGPSSQSR